MTIVKLSTPHTPVLKHCFTLYTTMFEALGCNHLKGRSSSIYQSSFNFWKVQHTNRPT